MGYHQKKIKIFFKTLFKFFRFKNLPKIRGVNPQASTGGLTMRQPQLM